MKSYLILFFVTFVFASHGQSFWLAYFDNISMGKNISLHNEFQFRNHNTFGRLDQLLIRNGIGINLSEDNNNILLGYAYIHNRAELCPEDKSARFDEHRIFQQFITKQRFGRMFLMHRYRIEERFIQHDFAMRFRYFSSIYYSLNKPVIIKNTFYLSSYNEIFINGKSNFFDRNRLYGGFGFALTDNIKLEFGALVQIKEDVFSSHLQFTLFNNMAFKHHR